MNVHDRKKQKLLLRIEMLEEKNSISSLRNDLEEADDKMILMEKEWRDIPVNGNTSIIDYAKKLVDIRVHQEGILHLIEIIKLRELLAKSYSYLNK